MKSFTRRDFLRTSMVGSIAAGYINPVIAGNTITSPDHTSARVALTTGMNRADMVFRALQPFSNEIRRAIGDRRIILKPNNVLIYVPLACTHAETLEGILEFLKSIGKLQNVIIAESSASADTLNGFENYGYFRLTAKYPVKLVDLDRQPSELLYVIDEKDFHPHGVRVSSLLLDPDSYVISVARMKTHNTVGATLSLKNIVFGAPVKDPGFTLYSEDKRFNPEAMESKPGTISYKRFVHGSGFRAVNYNMFSLASRLHPHLAVIDGYEGMEGNGPTLGTPVDHRVCVVSPDWLAADRVGIKLMGIDFADIGYLNYCAGAGLGTADLNKIEIIGENLSAHIRSYKLPDNYSRQLMWKNPVV